jgi:F-type H+-transporting ATPase subunit c
MKGDNMNKTLLVILGTVFSALPAFAEEVANQAAASAGVGNAGLYALAAGLGLGIAALGGSLAQGKIGAAAMDGIARNPQAQQSVFIPMILALVFVETLVLFTFAVAFLLQGKI